MAYQPANANDLKFLVRSTLLASDAVVDVVGSRIHGAHLQAPEAGTVDYPLVVIDFTGGAVLGATGYQTITMEVFTYSRESAGKALELYDHCFAALHQQLLRRDGVAVAGYALEITRPEEGWNESIRAYWTVGTYTLRASYRGAS